MSFPSAADARHNLGHVKRAADRYETATKAQIAQSIFHAPVPDRVTAMRLLLGSLGEIVATAEYVANEYGLDLEGYMVMVRGTADPDPSLFYPGIVDEAPDGVR